MGDSGLDRNQPLPLALVVTGTALVFLPVTRTFFHHDDFIHLYDIVNDPAAVFILKMHGFHLLLTTKAAFWTTWQIVGPNPALFMWTSLLAHLLNAILLFQLLALATARPWLSAACALAWGTMPLQEGAVNAYSVFGQMLCTTFALWSFLRVLRTAMRGAPSGIRGATLSALLVFIASTCFGVGLGIAVAMPAVALLVMPTGRDRRWHTGAFLVALPVIAIVYLMVEQWNVETLQAFPAAVVAPRDSTSLAIAAMLLAHLVGVGTVALALDGFFRNALYAGPLASVLLWSGAALGVAGFAVARPFPRRIGLAALLLAGAAYATIAAGRAFLAADPAAVALSSRYHYAATAFLVLTFGVALAAASDHLALRTTTRTAILSTWLAALAYAHVFAMPQIENYGHYRREVATALASMRSLVSQAPPGGDVYVPNKRFPIGTMMPGIQVSFPGWFAIYTVFVGHERFEGRRVFFVEPEDDIRSRGRAGPFGSQRLVRPDDAP